MLVGNLAACKLPDMATHPCPSREGKSNDSGAFILLLARSRQLEVEPVAFHSMIKKLLQLKLRVEGNIEGILFISSQSAQSVNQANPGFTKQRSNLATKQLN